MVKARRLSPKPVYDQGMLQELFLEHDVKPLHSITIWNHLLSNPEVQPHEVPGIPQSLVDPLRRGFTSLTSRVTSSLHSQDGTTTKLVVRLQDGESVEAVIMRYDTSVGRYAGTTRPGGPRATLCVSSQVGCLMGCTFCATGTMGLTRQLAAGEIVEQLVHALRHDAIRNVVFMGMGEPLNNYAAVLTAVRTMIGRPFCLAPSHITVSTVGVVPRLLSLSRDLPGVNLALSLHAPNQALRLRIVPTAKAYSVDKLVAAMDRYMADSGKGVFVEYVLLRGVNDSAAIACELGELLQGRKVVVNLIPYNSTDVDAEFQASTPEDTVSFQKILRENYGLHATVRQEMGQDIAGACGQLVISKNDGAGHLKPALVKDIEELCIR